jgi:hypothetical protein
MSGISDKVLEILAKSDKIGFAPEFEASWLRSPDRRSSATCP